MEKAGDSLKNMDDRTKVVTNSFLLILSVFFLLPSCNAPNKEFKGTTSQLKTELIFPVQEEHSHGSTIVELPNGDLLAGWFQGSGERWADDVRIMGARKKKNQLTWSDPFILADIKEFPDCNPVLFIDGKNRLWLMWMTIIANQWETALLVYRISEEYMDMDEAPNWKWQENLLLKPGGKTERGIQSGDPFVASVKNQIEEYTSYIGGNPDKSIYLERWKTWPWIKYLADDKNSRSHYPAIIVGKDGLFHVTYSYFQEDNKKTIKHTAFNEEWIKSIKW